MVLTSQDRVNKMKSNIAKALKKKQKEIDSKAAQVPVAHAQPDAAAPADATAKDAFVRHEPLIFITLQIC